MRQVSAGGCRGEVGEQVDQHADSGGGSVDNINSVCVRVCAQLNVFMKNISCELQSTVLYYTLRVFLVQNRFLLRELFSSTACTVRQYLQCTVYMPGGTYPACYMLHSSVLETIIILS